MNEKKKILIVDDAKFIRSVLNKTLTENNYEVMEAKDGKQAVEMYKKDVYDLVLLDINMPKLNGVDALKKMIQINKDARIIMLSVEVDEDIIDDCISFGALNYISKPFSDDIILQAVHVALYSTD